MINANIEIYGNTVNVDIEISDIKINKPSVGKTYYTASMKSNGEEIYEKLYGELPVTRGDDLISLAEFDVMKNQRLSNAKII